MISSIVSLGGTVFSWKGGNGIGIQAHMSKTMLSGRKVYQLLALSRNTINRTLHQNPYILVDMSNLRYSRAVTT
jgi:hypothetical protein